MQFQQSQNAQQPWGGPFPSLHLWPLQDTFQMKMIHLPEGQRIKIGRQTNAKTSPGERNAYFDSKVLSRLHAEVWEQGGKIYIKDVKSSNGTFINTERLSPEGTESEPFELKSEDLVEFGIDIVSEDNRTIVHHKVAARVYCCFDIDDAALSARELVHYQGQSRRNVAPPPPPPPPAVLSSGGKAPGMSFDHVLSKLQGELAKSRETGAELQGLASAMTDIQETLGGGMAPSQNGSAAHFIPPQFRSNSAEAQAALAGPHGQQAAAFIALQNQLTETQSSLKTHIERIRSLEDALHQHELLKSDVSQLREQMADSKREMELILSGSRGRQYGRRMDDDDDDARSVMTAMDDEEAEDRVRHRRKLERETSEMVKQNAELTLQVETLSTGMSEAVNLSRTLQHQHDDAMAAVRVLTERVNALETGIASRIADAVSETDRKWESWRATVEDGWKKERESWEAERERLRGVVRDWEEASRRAHEEVEDRELNESLSSDESDKAAPKRRRARRRRPSTKTVLAVRALRQLADEGASTPKQQEPDHHALKQHSKRNPDIDSSESGRDSGDTLREVVRKRDKARPQAMQPAPLFTIVVIAIAAGVVYYRSQE